ncbi:MAG: hypothetical protein D8M57_08835 [Candidatus Scalindua sp. AMX11]|nr:MAG: hypothetical protein DWQ00_10035 [Candidatus Scalindua sp.]NOG84502.1 hypothetical protein [Planctomycetota bacterium]RZV80490.1 MAG: hypothetical protein EX341_10590 [Candidatus Scalindua sp. SCAELEC01]TDE65289.1 MAG: hypothetical protein D8M57_08835 [Candidatus Scalindua sp. AMX11]
MIATKESLFKNGNSKCVPQWLIRYEKLFKIIYKISILYLILNIFISCFSLNVWFATCSVGFFILNKTNLLIIEIVKGVLLGAINERVGYEDNPPVYSLSMAIRFFQVIFFLGLIVLLVLGVRITLT